MTADGPSADLARYPLLDALRTRRSLRFGHGMEMKSGPLAFSSSREPLPLTEEEEALLAFAACGITGRAAADLDYSQGQGGTINDILDQTAQLTSALADRDQVIGEVITNLNTVLDTTVKHQQEFDNTVNNFETLITGLKNRADPLARAQRGRLRLRADPGTGLQHAEHRYRWSRRAGARRCAGIRCADLRGRWLRSASCR